MRGGVRDYNRWMDHHTVAAVSLIGICLDLLGGLYLAYDLLGGQHGPLRLLTRMVTYSILLGVGYGIGLGFFFGVACGAASGITVAIELHRSSGRQDHYPFPVEVVFSAIRGFAFGAAIYRTLGFEFALTFGALSTAGQAVAYSCGMRPGLDYRVSRRPRLTRRHLLGAVYRTVGYIATGLICAVVTHTDHIWPFALRVGVVTGIVTVAVVTVYPFIEYFADNLPERRLGVFGIWLVLSGFVMQSVQYWMALLDLPVT